VEYDIARCAVFSWFMMKKNQNFCDLLELAQESYPEKLDMGMLEKYAIDHGKSHLENTKRHKKLYENKNKYRKDVRFAHKMLKQAKKELRS